MNRSTRLTLVAGTTAAAVLATGSIIAAASMAGATASGPQNDRQVVAETAVLPDPVATFPALPPLPDVAKPAAQRQPNESARPAPGTPKPTSRTVSITRLDALKVAEKAANGTAMDVRDGMRDGVAAWVVTVKRVDGSIVDGYVDKQSGVVFAWQVVREAPAPSVAPGPSKDGGSQYADDDDREHRESDEDHDDEDHDDEDHDGDYDGDGEDDDD